MQSELIIHEISESNYNDLVKPWSEFVEYHKDGNIFQSPLYFKLLQETNIYNPIALLLKQSEEIVGCLIGYEHKFFGNLLKRIIIIGGPLIKDDNEIYLSVLLTYYKKKYSRSVFYTEFRNIKEFGNNIVESFKKQKIRWEDHLDIHMQLQNEDTFNSISKNKKRNLTKSINKGVEYREIRSVDEFRKSYFLIENLYKRIKLPLPTLRFFEKAYEIFDNKYLRCFVAVFEKQLIGVRYELVFKDEVFDWYAGDDKKHSNKYPNDGLILTILQKFKEEGYNIFDFGGAGKPNIPYGVRDHKLKFGGKLINPGRFMHTRYKVAYVVFQYLLDLRKKLIK